MPIAQKHRTREIASEIVGTVQGTAPDKMAMLVIATSMATALLVGAPTSTAAGGRAAVRMGLHELTAKGMDGTEVELKTLAGKNVIALNVASR